MEYDPRDYSKLLEPEITGNLLNLGYRIYEVPVSYRARSREEGKKLVWTNGVRAIVMLVKLRLRRPMDRLHAQRLNRQTTEGGARTSLG